MVQEKTQFELYCLLCDSTFSVANRCSDQILQHSCGKKHSVNLCFDKTTWHLSSVEPSKQTSSLTNTHEKELRFIRIWSWSGQVCRSTLDAESCWVWWFSDIMWQYWQAIHADVSWKYFQPVSAWWIKGFLCCIRWTQPMYTWWNSEKYKNLWYGIYSNVWRDNSKSK